MVNIHICNELDGVLALLDGPVYLVMDNNLKHLKSKLGNYPLIGIDTSEDRKSMESVAEIIGELLEAGADRGAFIVGIGGGITTDMAGFAASIYKRGVKFAFIPTTLLAQVDASIGGKNGVNIDSYKNIAGVIRQPQWVYICAEVLRSLAPKEFRAGVAEVLKTFMLFDPSYYSKAVGYFGELEEYYKNEGTYLSGDIIYKEEILTDIIGKCAQYKSGVVERDEFERGERRMLNLGHTFAHAIEKVCADSKKYEPIMHGEAVAIGMVLAAKVAEKIFCQENGLAERLADDLRRVGLPHSVPLDRDGEPIPMRVLVEALGRDKKVEGSSIHFILPREIGDVEDRLISLKELEEICNDLC